MGYKSIFSERAAKEYFDAIAWYKKRSLQAAGNFVSFVRQTLDEIEGQPDHFRLTYKNYHEAKIKKYPFSIVYFIDKKEQVVVITTIFHHKRNPRKKFR